MNDKLSAHLPLLAHWPKPPQLRTDTLAGITVAVMLVPQAMAYAMLAGLPPIVGLYASVAPLVVYGLMGSSRQLAVGPVAMVSLLVGSAIGIMQPSSVAEGVALAALLAALVGGMQLLMGVLRLGFIVRFLSHPVISGFTAAAALIIGGSQLGHLLGISIERTHHLHTILLQAANGPIHWPTALLGGAALLGLVALKRWAPGFPRFLAVVVGGTLAAFALDLGAQGVALVGTVPAGLPPFQLPAMDLDAARAMLPMAASIAIVGFVESISVATALARRHHDSVDATQELKALGASNLAASVFGGYPVTGGFSRTAVNEQAGARSGLSSLVSALLIAATLLWLTPLFAFLPKAVLAAIILSAVLGLIDVAEARHLYRVDKSDFTMWVLTFAATLTLGIEQGIALGVVASLVAFVKRSSQPHTAELGRLRGTAVYRKLERRPEAERVAGVVIHRVDAPLFFGNAPQVVDSVRAVLGARDDRVRHVVLDMSAVGSVDSTADSALRQLIVELNQNDIAVWLATVRGPVRDALHRSGLAATVRMVERIDDAVRAAERSPRQPKRVA